MISIVTDGFWCGPPTSIQKINTGGAPWPCPPAPTFANPEPSVQGALLRPELGVTTPGELCPPSVSISPGPYVSGALVEPDAHVSGVEVPEAFCDGIAIEGLGGWTFAWSGHEQTNPTQFLGMSQYGGASANVAIQHGSVGPNTEPSDGLLENGIGTARINHALSCNLCAGVQLTEGLGPSNLPIFGDLAIHYRLIYKPLTLLPSPAFPTFFNVDYYFQLRNSNLSGQGEANFSIGMFERVFLSEAPVLQVTRQTLNGGGQGAASQETIEIPLASLPQPWFGRYHIIDMVCAQTGTSNVVSVFIDGQDFSYTTIGAHKPYTLSSPAVALFTGTTGGHVFAGTGLMIFAGLALGREIDFTRHVDDARAIGVI